MRKYIVVVCLLMLSGLAYAQFEGQIDMKVTRGAGDEQQGTQLSISIKQGMLALTVQDPENKEKGGNMIFRSDRNVLWIVNPKDKTYLEIAADKEMLNPKKKERKESEEKYSLRKTGKGATVAGYACDEWVADDGEEVTTILGTTKLGNVYEGFRKAFARWGGEQMESGTEGWQRELIKKEIFPLKTVTTSRSEITETQEVTKIEKRSLAASLFEIPAGYKKQSLEFDMNKMMKGMNKSNTRSMSKDDLEKMMRQMKEHMKDSEEKEDSTDKDDDDDE